MLLLSSNEETFLKRAAYGRLSLLYKFYPWSRLAANYCRRLENLGCERTICLRSSVQLSWKRHFYKGCWCDFNKALEARVRLCWGIFAFYVTDWHLENLPSIPPFISRDNKINLTPYIMGPSCQMLLWLIALSPSYWHLCICCSPLTESRATEISGSPGVTRPLQKGPVM